MLRHNMYVVYSPSQFSSVQISGKIITKSDRHNVQTNVQTFRPDNHFSLDSVWHRRYRQNRPINSVIQHTLFFTSKPPLPSPLPSPSPCEDELKRERILTVPNLGGRFKRLTWDTALRLHDEWLGSQMAKFAPTTLQPGAIQGKEKIKFCNVV